MIASAEALSASESGASSVPVVAVKAAMMAAAWVSLTGTDWSHADWRSSVRALRKAGEPHGVARSRPAQASLMERGAAGSRSHGSRMATSGAAVASSMGLPFAEANFSAASRTAATG